MAANYRANRWLNKKKMAGFCELCGKHTDFLERHHIKYKPEVTINLCHLCHFKVHHQWNMLPLEHRRKIFIRSLGLSEREYLLKHPEKFDEMFKRYFPAGRK